MTNITVIDADEFEAARRDPELAAFIAEAEAYMDRVVPVPAALDLLAAERRWAGAWSAYFAGRAR